MLNNPIYSDVFGNDPKLTTMMRSLSRSTRNNSEMPFLSTMLQKS
jgi:hypothetical protein